MAGRKEATRAGPGDGTGARRIRRIVAIAALVSVVSLAGLFAAFHFLSDVPVVAAFGEIRPVWVLLALALHVTSLFLRAVRIWLLAPGLGERVSLRFACEVALAGVFGASITPSRMGGEPVRVYLLYLREMPMGPASALVVGERALDLLFFSLAGLAASVLLVAEIDRSPTFALLLPFALFLTVGLLVFVSLILVNPRMLRPLLARLGPVLHRLDPERIERLESFAEEEVQRFRTSVRALLRHRRRYLGVSMLATVASWLAELLIFWVLLLGFGFHLDPVAVVLVGVVVNLLTTLPLTPGGSGIAEVSTLALLRPLASGLTPAYVLVWRVVTYYLDILVGGILATRLIKLDALGDLLKRKPGPV
ncbi:MAG: lysylphosphatidylglycerol synthase transmembrane domain-containing protein [Methanobacteriota archaeon]